MHTHTHKILARVALYAAVLDRVALDAAPALLEVAVAAAD